MGSINGQKHNAYIQGRYASLNPNDVVFTPDWLAEKICSMFSITGKILEPCKGEGAFLKFLPADTDWCEIVDGRNFYDYTQKVDWIVTNPPYSDFNRFLSHSFELADNIVLLVPIAKLMKSMGTLKAIMDYGGFVSCHFLPASKAGFPFGFPCGIFYLKRGYKGNTKFALLDDANKQLDLIEDTNQKSLEVFLDEKFQKAFGEWFKARQGRGKVVWQKSILTEEIVPIFYVGNNQPFPVMLLAEAYDAGKKQMQKELRGV